MSKRKRPNQRFVRISLTFPPGFDDRLERLAQVTGSGSLSEVVRWAINDFEVKYGLPAMPAILDQMKKDKKTGEK
ncbi:hypothetical protein C4585_00205 [Candidatus Parcubacteria bacterium]|nr:MAG: hypothetical protein C4585_00205 [Candidatus Parcubacteria bacterium]